MTVKPGARINGIRTLEHLRERCRMDSETGCWLWSLSMSHNRPAVVLKLDGRHRSLNGRRAAVFLRDGVMPGGDTYVWRHVGCPNAECCNPEHARVGTLVEMRKETASVSMRNTIASTARGIAQRDARLAKLTIEQVRQMRARASEPRKQLAAEFGVSVGNVWLILAHRTWRESAAGVLAGSSVFSQTSGRVVNSGRVVAE